MNFQQTSINTIWNNLPRDSAQFLVIAFENGILPSSMLEAYMVLLLIPGKDLQECSSYRPIALLNTDLKILTKVLASCLAKVIPSLVDIDQMGFMPWKSTDTNLRRLFTNLQLDTPEVSEKVIVSIDIEKAFDSVDRRYMQSIGEYGIWA